MKKSHAYQSSIHKITIKSKNKLVSQILEHVFPSKLQYPHTLHVKDGARVQTILQGEK
jgi:hypothetical protein